MSVTTTTRLSRLERLTRTIAEEQRQAEQRRQYELDQPFRSFLILDPAYRACLRALHEGHKRRAPKEEIDRLARDVADRERELRPVFEAQRAGEVTTCR